MHFKRLLRYIDVHKPFRDLFLSHQSQIRAQVFRASGSKVEIGNSGSYLWRCRFSYSVGKYQVFERCTALAIVLSTHNKVALLFYILRNFYFVTYCLNDSIKSKFVFSSLLFHGRFWKLSWFLLHTYIPLML
jgi:hypothetical protein